LLPRQAIKKQEQKRKRQRAKREIEHLELISIPSIINSMKNTEKAVEIETPKVEGKEEF
jgi:hypothetical protein